MRTTCAWLTWSATLLSIWGKFINSVTVSISYRDPGSASGKTSNINSVLKKVTWIQILAPFSAGLQVECLIINCWQPPEGWTMSMFWNTIMCQSKKALTISCLHLPCSLITLAQITPLSFTRVLQKGVLTPRRCRSETMDLFRQRSLKATTLWYTTVKSGALIHQTAVIYKFRLYYPERVLRRVYWLMKYAWLWKISLIKPTLSAIARTALMKMLAHFMAPNIAIAQDAGRIAKLIPIPWCARLTRARIERHKQNERISTKSACCVWLRQAWTARSASDSCWSVVDLRSPCHMLKSGFPVLSRQRVDTSALSRQPTQPQSAIN